MDFECEKCGYTTSWPVTADSANIYGKVRIRCDCCCHVGDFKLDECPPGSDKGVI